MFIESEKNSNNVIDNFTSIYKPFAVVALKSGIYKYNKTHMQVIAIHNVLNRS
jgi:hypothetical protein